MEVILKEDILNLGYKDDIVNVKRVMPAIISFLRVRQLSRTNLLRKF